MKKFFLIFFALFLGSLKAEVSDSEFTIVFVHIGTKMPEYLDWALMQARLFNDCKIILIANEEPLNRYKKKLDVYNVVGVSCESLKQSPRHKIFSKNSVLDRKFGDGFWYFASERFFYLDDLMEQYQMTNVVHVESDNMLYVTLSEISSVLLKNYPGLGVTFDTDERCIPGIVFIRNAQAIALLTKFMMNQNSTEDMYAIGKFRKKMRNKLVKTLPIVHAEYIYSHSIRSLKPEIYSNLVGEFCSLFDAAYFGQYLGGQYPGNGPSKAGYINPDCVINSSFFEYTWERDEKNRLVPFAHFQGKKLRINNLHVHCKRLWDFYSLKQE